MLIGDMPLLVRQFVADRQTASVKFATHQKHPQTHENKHFKSFLLFALIRCSTVQVAMYWGKKRGKLKWGKIRSKPRAAG